jgi:SAM-dependent methyltransferase
MTERALTDVNYWQGFWRRGARLRQLSSIHPYFGSRGIFMRVLRKHCGALAGKKILELGGGGHNYRLLALRKWARAEVTALDFSELSLQQLAELFQMHSEPVRTIQSDLFDGPGAADENAFDVVCHWGVIEHFQPPQRILQASRRFLKPGGLLIFSLPNLNSWGAHWFRRYSPVCWDTHYPYRAGELIGALDNPDWAQPGFQFFGYPAVKYAPWESPHKALKLLDVLQKLGILSSYLVPYHRFGNEKFSLELLIHARRAD